MQLTFGGPYLKNIRNQTKYRYRWAAIDVEKQNVDGEEEKVRKFKGTIHTMWSNRGPEDIELYFYTNNRTITMPPSNSLLMPVSPIRWYNPSKGYYWAIRMDYEDDYYDRLKQNGVRQALRDLYYTNDEEVRRRRSGQTEWSAISL